MRDDLETREIADTELDAVSGGVVHISGGLAGAATNDVSNIVNGLQTVQEVRGLANRVNGEAAGVTGVHVHTNAATGAVGL